ncbi:hypothetical protein EN875_034050 [Mesorhizobium sp. M2D.F.Ca.ET.232.01.1.1]|uniref:hypothetical protein n=1 Tax=Mesorhizobium sp. M2D.F.Ca.ET.232.01.1.1 TaxID=2496670 RepID=UPI000FCCD06F|nr:hypothetical protein [Mesorhizobium sp. M2D.F.Ca.ET.232.01.1.1]TGP27365.1 hypothetical protein EN875_034050 [Mesorhizobium sp. M2D.F.Ca.ET.232.01.1.1]
MVALLDRISESFPWRLKAASAKTTVTHSAAAQNEEMHKIGDYYADYSELTDEQLAKTDPDMEAFIARSRVVSVKRGL